MKKVSEVFMIVGAILGIIGAVAFVIVPVVLFVLAGNSELILEMAEDYGGGRGMPDFPDETAKILSAGLVAAGIFMLLLVVPSVVAVVLGLKNKANGTKTGLIATIVLSAIACNEVLLAGAVIGLIAHIRGNRPAVIEQ